MTAPLPGGVTPIYGLRYITQGQPVRFTRQYLEENAKTIEAALASRGVPATGAADLAALAGRVGTLEADPWVPLTLSQGTPLSGWPTPRARLEGDLVRLELHVSGPINGPVTTLPAMFRPNSNRGIPGVFASGAAGLGQVQAGGNVIIGATIAAGGFLILSGTYPLT